MKIQSIFRIPAGKYVVLVFVEESVNIQYTQAVVHANQDLPMIELARKLLEDKRFVAVEITSWDQNGVRVER
jgi:hypothetical protein